MLDPLTALGVAGSVLQIIDFGFELVADGNQIYHSTSGALEEHKAADELARDLESLTKRLTKSQDQWTKSHGDIPLQPDEIRLRNICDRCTEIAIELQRQLQKLKRQDGGKRQRLQSYKKALLSVWRKDQIDAISTRLARYQQELDTHVLLGLRKSVQESEWKNSEQFASLNRQTQRLTVAVLEGDGKIDSRLSDQAEILARIHEQTNQILSSLDEGKRPVSPPPRYNSFRGQFTTPLHEAAQSGELLKVKQLLRSSTVDINAQDESGCTPLHLASTTDVTKRLLSETRRIVIKDAEDDEGRTALHHAVLKRRLDVIKALLEGGVNYSLEDDSGRNAMFYAQDCPAAMWLLTYGPNPETKAEDRHNNTGLLHMASLGDLEGVKFFLRNGVDINVSNVWGKSAISEACQHGSLKIVECLIRTGKVHDHNDTWTPLFWAITGNRIEVVRLLLREGANRDVQLPNGNTVLQEACEDSRWEIVEVLLEAGYNAKICGRRGRSPLQHAARVDQPAVVQMLLERRANVNHQAHDGATALWDATQRGHFAVVKILLEAGADPNIMSSAEEGSPARSALTEACSNGHYECAELLLDYGAKLIYNLGGPCIALGAATRYGYTKVVELLLDHGANMEHCDPYGHSALSIAAYNGQNDVISLLVDNGAHLEQGTYANQEAEYDETPLIEASSQGFERSVKLLLDFGAQANARNTNHATALHYASEKGHDKVVEVLVYGGADVDARTHYGTTALMEASSRGYVEIVRLLLEANANTRLRDQKGSTAWILAISQGHDRELEHLLKPGPDENETLQRLQADSSPSEIAAYMNEVYR